MPQNKVAVGRCFPPQICSQIIRSAARLHSEERPPGDRSPSICCLVSVAQRRPLSSKGAAVASPRALHAAAAAAERPR